MKAICGAVAVLLWTGCGAFGVDYYVDNVSGSDARDGRSGTVVSDASGPFRTITHALRAAGAGDTVHLNASGVPYRQTADFYGHAGGAAGQPLVLDGHGATLCGSDPCPPAGWQPWQDGILMRDDMVSQGFLVVDGQMVFMTQDFNVLQPGELSYHAGWKRLYLNPPEGKTHADCRVEIGLADGTGEVLDGGQWHPSHSRIKTVKRYQLAGRPEWIKLDGREVTLTTARHRLGPGQWCVEDKVLYFRPPAGKEIGDLTIECVVRENGVQMSGQTAHVIVRNLKAIHVSNDGYNIHGHVTRAEFYDCHARDCGDEGFSAHDTCETLLDGAVYVNCDNGIANVNDCHSITRNVVLKDARAVGYLITTGEGSRHELTNALLIDNPAQFSAQRTAAPNVLIVRTRQAGERGAQAVRGGAATSLERTTAVGNTGLLMTGEGCAVRFASCLLGAGQGVLHVRADAPMEVLKMENVVADPGLVVQWSSRYPWTSQPIGEWFADAELEGAASGCRTQDLAGLTVLREGSLPASLPDGAGCSRELLERYAAFLRSGE